MTSGMNHASQIGDVNRQSPRIKRILHVAGMHGNRPDALIQVLHAAQGMYGYLPLRIIRFVADLLKVPPSQAYGVATFYNFFSLQPKGEHNCLVCMGTACYVKGAQAVLERIEQDFGVKAGGTTADSTLGLQAARCIGACGMAPAVTFDEEILPRVKPGDVTALLRAKLGRAA